MAPLASQRDSISGMSRAAILVNHGKSPLISCVGGSQRCPYTCGARLAIPRTRASAAGASGLVRRARNGMSARISRSAAFSSAPRTMSVSVQLR